MKRLKKTPPPPAAESEYDDDGIGAVRVVTPSAAVSQEPTFSATSADETAYMDEADDPLAARPREPEVRVATPEPSVTVRAPQERVPFVSLSSALTADIWPRSLSNYFSTFLRLMVCLSAITYSMLAF